MIVTLGIIEQGRSDNGGWSLFQLKCLGITSFEKGWKKKVIGKDFPKQEIDNFLFFKNKHLKK